MKKLAVALTAVIAGGMFAATGFNSAHADSLANNGWGNGAEGTNKGSDEGGTAGSKSDELWTAGDGPAPDKFTTR